MALTESTTAGITSPPADRGGQRHRIWVVQYGPCWCRAEPDSGGSFDFVRFRTADSASLDRNLMVVSDRVIIGSGQIVRQVYDHISEAPLVLATGHCPGAQEFWDELPGGWVPVDELVPVDVRIRQCFSGYPEILLATVLDALHTADAVRPSRETTPR